MKKQSEYNKKWQENNKERQNYLTYRSRTKTFITKMADIEDLKKIKKILDEKIENYL